MECTLISELPDILLGLLIIIGFSTRKNPILHHQLYALLFGLFFIVASVGEIIFGINLDVVEFFGILGILLVIEKFISTNTDTRIHYEYFLSIIALTLFVVFVFHDFKYFHTGTLFVLFILALNLRSNVHLLGEEIRNTLLFSGILALLSITTLLTGFEVVNAFFVLEPSYSSFLQWQRGCGGWNE